MLNRIIPKTVKKFTLDCVGFAAHFLSSHAPCTRTRVACSRPKNLRSRLAKGKLFNRFRYIVCFLCALTINGVLRGETVPTEIQEISGREKVTIEDVKTMNDAGVTDGKIIDLIQSTNSVFYLTPADIAGLKKAGVSERVIDYMQQTPYQKLS